MWVFLISYRERDSMFSCKSTTHKPPSLCILAAGMSHTWQSKLLHPSYPDARDGRGMTSPYFGMLLRVTLSLLNSSMLCRFPPPTRCWMFQSHTQTSLNGLVSVVVVLCLVCWPVFCYVQGGEAWPDWSGWDKMSPLLQERSVDLRHHTRQ